MRRFSYEGNFYGEFCSAQVKTFHHQVALWGIPIMIISGYVHPYLLWIGLAFFFLFTSFKRLKSILYWLFIILGVSIAFPPLAPFLFILMIIFFVFRIGFIATHWRPFLYGLLFYSLMAFIVNDSWNLYQYHTSFFDAILYHFDFYFIYSKLWIGIGLAFVTTVLLHMMLIDCYKNGYGSEVALGMMGSVPLIIISLLLPFLKIPIGELFMDTHVAKDPVVTTEKTYVKPHVRTAPDGIKENNFSYDRPDKIAPNSETVHVRGYWRSVPGESSNVDGVRESVPSLQTSPKDVTLTPGYERRRDERGVGNE